MSRYDAAKAEFEVHWLKAWPVFRPLCERPDDGRNIASLVSLIKSLAMSCYIQGRADELAYQLEVQKRLTKRIAWRDTNGHST